ncbi:unnamed protein product, partial [marine sediment metagenome]
WICDIKGLRILAPFLVVIVGKEIDFMIAVQRKAGLLKEPVQVCFTQADVQTTKTKTYYSHGIKYTCPEAVDPTKIKCFPIEKDKGPSGIHEFKIYSGWGTDVIDARHIRTEFSDDYTYEEVRDWEKSSYLPLETAIFIIGQGYGWQYWHTWEIYRSAIYFKNKVLRPDFEIKEAEIVLRVFFKPIVKDFDVVIQRGIELEDEIPIYPSQPPVPEDYNRFLYSFIGGLKNTSEMGRIYSYFSIKLNDLGLTWLNKKRDGITKFILRSSDDINGIPPKLEEERKECCQL